MTRLPEAAELRAPFDGREFRFKEDVARFERRDGIPHMRVVSTRDGEHLYRVTRVIGGRYREDFAGVEVPVAGRAAAVAAPAPAPAPAPAGVRQSELILPVSFVLGDASFRVKGYSVLVRERPGLRAGGVWNETCIFCHNTVPYLDDLLGALHGPGAPGYQGEVVDRALPDRRRLDYRIVDAAGLVDAVREELAALGAGEGTVRRAAAEGDVRVTLRRAIVEARSRFAPAHFIEMGVGCEACHGGGREHVDDPRRLPSFEPRAPFLRATAAAGPAPSRAEWQNRACARCHQVLFSRYPYTWEGGLRRAPAQAGGSNITSGEARDFLLGGCARAMACSACHDPHGEDRSDALARLATPAGNGVCTGCHRELAAPAAVRAHAHHDPAGAGGSCVACHMPKKNMGLGYTLTRYHRIGSPTDPARVERDRPIECALCHTDRTVEALLDDIRRLWGRRYDAAAIRRLYPRPQANALLATIQDGLPHEQAAAIGAAGAARFGAAAEAIAGELGNPYPLVRYYARAAVEAITGRPCAVDPNAPARAGAPPPGMTTDPGGDED
jgi:predicted CXXCH cytochrome family protein